ncbi:MAG TPA: hypothetical protein VL175_06740 [Pirellulales bacterium]|jgi:hypothetical protein|nr:hypothetical protein [Pirellulales bacterium]
MVLRAKFEMLGDVLRGTVLSASLFVTGVLLAAERTEHFDREPNWDNHNNRATVPEAREVRQDFGYQAAPGGAVGQVGGFITPAAEPAYYGAKIAPTTFDEPLSASGTFRGGDGAFHVLLGFFNSATLNEWRTPNTIALRLMGRGDVIYAYLEYCSSRWRAGGDSPKSFLMGRRSESGRKEPTGFAIHALHRWSLNYDPHGNAGSGAITATIDDQTSICHLDPEHRQDGARFDRFGLLTVMKSVDSGGEIWLGDIAIHGRAQDLSHDPGWDGFQNRRTYTSSIVRPRFDFGFSSTQYARGERSGELGGLIFRGDCREPNRMAHYADRLESLSLDKPIRAAGKVCLRRGVSDSGVLIGFFNSRESTASSPAQDSGLPRSFLGISTDAPSREGFYFGPTYRVGGDSRAEATASKPPHLYPDGSSRDWSFAYTPASDGGGRIVVTLNRERVELPLPAAHRRQPVSFDRFGILSTWIDGNSQTIFFDDLTYTFRQD